MAQPSSFTSYPYDSYLQNSGSETVAQNIMVILSHTGDKWRSLSFAEYHEQRLNDGNYSAAEAGYFASVVGWTVNERMVRKFSSTWNKI